MAKLKTIEKKILYELTKDARQSYKEMARKIQSKKDTVAYYVNQLQEKKIITKYVPVFDLAKLGIFSSKIYLNLQGLSKDNEKKMIKNLVEDPKVAWVARSIGRWDLMLGFYTKDILHFAEKKNKILSKWGKFIENYDITQIEGAVTLERDYLFDKKRDTRKEFLFTGIKEIKKIDETDKKIMSLIKNDGRFEYHNISERINLDARTIHSRIKNLKKKGIIQGYTTFIDTEKLGMQLHKICISLKDYGKENFNSLVGFLKQNPSTIHFIKLLGGWELEVEIEEENMTRIYEHISEIKNRFPEVVKNTELATITEELKLNFFPEDFL
ncbi:MAG: Lrp/AsnC family transcriptional regulator [Nanobdellota archaeon]